MTTLSSDPCDRPDEPHGVLFTIDNGTEPKIPQSQLTRFALQAYQFANHYIERSNPAAKLLYAQVSGYDPINRVVDETHCCFYWENPK